MSLTPELITQFGLLGKVRTGQPLLDALLCLLLPLVLRWAQPRLNRLSLQATATLRQWLTGKAGRKEVVRVIEHVAYEDGYYYDPDGQPANAVLQQALLSYINNCTTSLDAAVASSHSPLAISAPTGPGAARTCARTCARSCTCACACSSPMKALQDMGTAYLSLERRRRRLAAPGDDAASDSDDEGSGERSGSGKSSSGGGGSVSSAGRLREAAAYGLNLAPPVRVWQDLGNGVEFMRYTYVHSSSGSSTYKRRRIGHVVKLRSFGTDGPARVAGLITAALQDHRAQKAARPADRHRYLYVPTCLDPPAISPAPGEPSAGADGRGGGGGGGGGKAAAPQVAAVFKRYRLSSEKTFASLFHPAKDELLRLVAQFEGRQGRFAVPGYPQKLGLLLYGPPGTGKTSLIKALAQRTGRSVVSVPLARIATNQQLMDIMTDTRVLLQRRQTSGGGGSSKRSGSNGDEDDEGGSSCSDEDDEGGSAITLPFNKVIYVLEDVDAAGGVVARRSPPPQPQQRQPPAERTAPDTAPAAAVDSSGVLNGGGSSSSSSSARSSMGGDDVAPSDLSHRRRGPPAAADAATAKTWAAAEPACVRASHAAAEAGAEAVALAAALAESIVGSCNPGSSSGGHGQGHAGCGHYSAYAGYASSFRRKHRDDALNLAGILNVLDGAVDTPGRIVVMTTNCPDSLDPALIRPGRINKVLYLGRLRLAEASAMMRHYCFPGPAGAPGGAGAGGVGVDGAGGGEAVEAARAWEAEVAEAEAALAAVWVDDVLSPAQLEAMCGEAETWQELVEAVGAAIGSGGTGGAEAAGWNHFERC